ncbi:MAG: ester cyclase [Granulosicoccus sp.]|nr:ester cyclase [Granulosicoccus sp.]
MTYADNWTDFPDYIIGITHDIWEGRGIESLNRYYAKDIAVRSPMGVAMGNEATKAATMATIHEFPDRQLFAEDVIWSATEHGYLSSHRIITTATHSQDGQFGQATGKKFAVRVIADCAADGQTINDEWLVRDYGGVVRQLGMEPRQFAQRLIDAEGGPENAAPVFTPSMDVTGPYLGRGNDNQWGKRYADDLMRVMNGEFSHAKTAFDRAAIGHYAGAQEAIGRDAIAQFWIGLKSSFPLAEFRIHHQIGMDADMLCPRASLRWSLDGTHDGWGTFGKPSGAEVHVMGLSHAEYGPWGLRRETALYDEIAVWKQILMHVRG